MKKSRSKHKASLSTQTQEFVASLAGRMADDFNNILTTVMGACSLIGRDDLTNTELQKCVLLIRTSAEHAADLSSNLLLIATKEREKKTDFN